jgi:ABC-2 type transport system permease protein
MNANVLVAIFRRNFVSYFSSPTGYVFLCMFVLLSGFAAFWPHEFFNANLANLDQLNKYLPYILLVFVPAITMSIWAEERRLGTDELLLTIPAGDLEVVLGKYLAAVAIYSASLAFSAVCNYSILEWLGDPDLGLFLGMYFGYWMVGLTMLAVGMVASFLTSNLTVGFILGAAFNAPLVFAANAEAIFPGWLAVKIARWSIAGQFRDFGRGVISLSGVAYFALLVVVMLYLCMVLLGRRHWSGGRDGQSMLGHYIVRGLAMLVIALSVTVLCAFAAVRFDVTSETLNSLSPKSRELIRNLNSDRPVVIQAFISPENQIPESYVQTRLNLMSRLQELEAIGGNKLKVEINETPPFSDEAARAEDQFDITSREVQVVSRGAVKLDSIFLGVAFSCGLDKVVIPFVDRGIPIEYELVRSISTVARKEGEPRKKLGVLRTDAELHGRFNFQMGTSTPKQPVLDELEKQYEVVEIDPTTAISDDLDVLVAVQPSSLTEEQMKNFIDAVKRGIPTAIFEDPLPVFIRAPGTTAPKMPPGGMFGGPPAPKGDMGPLWDALGINFQGSQIVYQDYNPYPKIGGFAREFVFVGPGSGAEEPFNEDDAITSGLQLVLLPFPGYMTRGKDTGPKYTPLLFSAGGRQAGTIAYDDAMRPFGGLLSDQERRSKAKPGKDEMCLAARIKGSLKPEFQTPKELSSKPAEDSAAKTDNKSGEKNARKPGDINVIVVADCDCLSAPFFDVRARGNDPDMEVFFDFDNVTFVLNVIDSLAGDDRFADIRKRRPRHRTLLRLEQAIEVATTRANKVTQDKQEAFEQSIKDEQKKLDAEVAKLEKELKDQKIDEEEASRRIAIALRNGNARINARREQLERELKTTLANVQRDLTKQIQREQDWYKLWAVVAPPIFPFLMGLVVFFNRRAKEREGVAKSRLRS